MSLIRIMKAAKFRAKSQDVENAVGKDPTASRIMRLWLLGFSEG